MNKVIPHDVAVQIANWWADKISHTKFDNGDTSETGFMAMALALMSVQPVTEEQREKFVKALVERIDGKENLFLDVDYHPSKDLREAAKEAGISENNFPWKTFVVMYRNYDTDGFKIIARHGYRAEPVTLYEC